MIEQQLTEAFWRAVEGRHWELCVIFGQAVVIWRLWTRGLYAGEGWRRERERNSQREIAIPTERLEWQSAKLRELLDVFLRGPERTLELPPEDSVDSSERTT